VDSRLINDTIDKIYLVARITARNYNNQFLCKVKKIFFLFDNKAGF